jgi:hypothetical protein
MSTTSVSIARAKSAWRSIEPPCAVVIATEEATPRRVTIGPQIQSDLVRSSAPRLNVNPGAETLNPEEVHYFFFFFLAFLTAFFTAFLIAFFFAAMSCTSSLLDCCPTNHSSGACDLTMRLTD